MFLDPSNVGVWKFFWASDQVNYDYAKDHFGFVLTFKDEFEKGSFFERFYLLKRKVESLRIKYQKEIAK